MRRFAFSIFLMFYTLSAASMENYVFTPIDGNSGLSGNQVRNITQLRDGRMMITTEGLLNIYDGTAFTYLHYTDNNSHQLSGYAGFHHEYVDNRGYMWLKNQHSLFLIDINRERFADNPGKLLSSMGITEPLSDFFMDKSKNIWVITQSDNLYYLPKGERKKQLFVSKVSHATRQNDQVYDLAVSNAKLYLFFRSGVLVCYDIKSRKELYRQQSLDSSQREKYSTTSFVMPAKDRFFQLRNGPGGGTMLSFDIRRKQWKTVLETDYWLNYLSIDQSGNIWLTCKEGMWRISQNLNKKEFIPQLKLVDGQNINTEVSTIYHDNQGGMWLGTLNRGLLYYHPDRFKFKNIGKSVFPSNNAEAINVTCFTEDKNGSILVGTRQGIFRYNPNTKTVTSYSEALSGLSCNALLKDKKGRIWIGTNNTGLFCIDERGTMCRYPSGPKTIHAILENDGNFYISTNDAGFGVFNPETGQYRQTEISKAVSYNQIFQLSRLTGSLLAGICRKGFFIYDSKTARISLYSDTHRYNALFVDSKNQLWLGSQDGLHLWDIKKETKKSFYTDDGLVNNYIQSIAEDGDGTIWVSTSNGLTRLSPQKDESGGIAYSLASFNRVDGVISNEFWERSLYIAGNGSMFWGGIDGFNELPLPGAVVSRQTTVPLFVNFLLFNKKVESGVAYDDNLILEKPFTITKEITLNYDQNFISLEFSALNYVNPSQTYYRYQLSGVDQTEQEIQSSDGRGRVNYTNLQPGTYYFKVRAANNSKAWTDHYAIMKIQVRAPFWKTGFAYGLYVFLTIAGIFFGIRMYVRRKRQKLVQEQKEKLNEMKSAFLQNVNEELSQPLTQIIAPLDTILKHTDEGRLKAQLKEIQTNASDLKELVNQLSEGVLSPVPVDENELNMEVLLLNMRRLLEGQKERREQASGQESPEVNETFLSAFDEKLIQKALRYVEENLDNPNYSVELLSKDMGMDRTGLYRKLVHVIGKTPTTFIRSVRMKRAAKLLEEGFTVAEVADKVGFSTASYLTKCFQEEFGMKPSQYVSSLKQPKSVQNQ